MRTVRSLSFSCCSWRPCQQPRASPPRHCCRFSTMPSPSTSSPLQCSAPSICFQYRSYASPSSSFLLSSSPSPSRAVFVHNLHFEVSDEALRKFMERAGRVEAIDLANNYKKNKKNKKNKKGVAVVTFESKEGAKAALDQLQGEILFGREVQLREDRGILLGAPLPSHAPRSSASSPSSIVDEEPEGRDGGLCSVFVGNLDKGVTNNMLKQHMETIGPVLRSKILCDSLMESKGCGIVVYKHSDDAKKAIKELYNTVLKGRLIFIREDRESVSARRLKEAVSHEKRACILLGNFDRKQENVENAIRDFMGKAGPVRKVLVNPQLKGKGRGKILVEFDTKASADRAVASLHGTIIGDNKVSVQRYG